MNGPESIGDIVSRLFVAKGWGRRSERARLEEAWVDSVGPELAEHTRLGPLRRGVLEVVVDSPVLMHEMGQFGKRRILQELARHWTGSPVTDLRLRAGVIDRPQGRDAT